MGPELLSHLALESLQVVALLDQVLLVGICLDHHRRLFLLTADLLLI